MVSEVDVLFLRSLTIQRIHFRPWEMLQTALPQFLSLCVSLETLICDPRLLRFAHQVTLPNLIKFEIHGNLRLDEPQECTFRSPGGDSQLTSINVLRSGWLEIFHAIPHLSLPTLESLYIHYNLSDPRLREVEDVEDSLADTSINDLLITLDSTKVDFWPYLNRLIGKAKFISLHMELHYPTEDIKEESLQVIQVNAATGMSDAAKDAIQFYVS